MWQPFGAKRICRLIRAACFPASPLRTKMIWIYGFFSKDYFREHQLHRALYHNFVFIGIVSLINPYLALGAFCHTLLDGINTAKDRGVEWLYPFSRLVKKARYDHEGKKIAFDIKTKLYMYQNDPVELTRKTAEDMKDYTLRPWRRIYGPFYSGGILDIGILVGSTALILFLTLLSVFGIRTFIDFYQPQLSFNFIGPLSYWRFGHFSSFGRR